MLRRVALLAQRAWCLLRRDPQTTRVLLRLASQIVILSLLMKLGSLSRVIRLLSPSPRQRKPFAPDQSAALLDRLLSLNFWVFTPTCWKRAIILHRCLAQQGLSTQIVFGVRKSANQQLDGHAWLEVQGQPLYEAVPPEYVTTMKFP